MFNWCPMNYGENSIEKHKIFNKRMQIEGHSFSVKKHVHLILFVQSFMKLKVLWSAPSHSFWSCIICRLLCCHFSCLFFFLRGRHSLSANLDQTWHEIRYSNWEDFFFKKRWWSLKIQQKILKTDNWFRNVAIIFFLWLDFVLIKSINWIKLNSKTEFFLYVRSLKSLR